MKRLLRLLLWAAIPAAFIGPGTVTVAASAGASHGHALLWALAFSTVATLVLQEAAARVRLASGLDLAAAIRVRARRGAAGLLATLLVLGAIVVGNAAYEAGNLLGAAAGAELAAGLPPRLAAAALGLAAGAVLWVGTPRAVARALGAAVAFMGVAFLATAVLLRPDAGSLLRGSLLPTLPAGAGLLVLGLVGTTVVPYNLFLGSGLASDQSLREMRWGLGLSVVLGGIVSAAVLVVGAAVEGPFSYAAVAGTLAARLGPWAGDLFAWGLFAAGLSSAVTAPLAAALTARGLFEDGSGRWSEGSGRFRAVWGGVLLAGVVFGATGVRPVPAIVAAQALNGVLLPFAAAVLLVVANDRGLMGRAANGALANVLAVPVVAVATLLGATGVVRAGAAAVGAEPAEGAVLGVAAAAVLGLAVPVARAVRRGRDGG